MYEQAKLGDACTTCKRNSLAVCITDHLKDDDAHYFLNNAVRVTSLIRRHVCFVTQMTKHGKRE